MKRLEQLGKCKDGIFETSADNKIYEKEFLREHNGEIIKRIWCKGRLPKTLAQIRFLYAGLRSFALYLGYADEAELKRDVKESIGYFDVHEVRNIKTGDVETRKIYKSFANLKKDSPVLEDFLNLCAEQQFPLRHFYDIFKAHGLESSKQAMAKFLQMKNENLS